MENKTLQIEEYATIYYKTYKVNRQEANDYLGNIRRLTNKETALSVLQRAMEMSLQSYNLSLK